MKCLLKPPHDRKTVKRHLEQRPDFHVVGHRPRTHGESGQLGPDLLQITASALGRPKSRTLDVVNPMLSCEPLSDMMARCPVFSEPVIAKVKKYKFLLLIQRSTVPPT